MENKKIQIIDLFAGPGGLGEGFSAFKTDSGSNPFKIAISIEKDINAHKTLSLRSFYRKFKQTPDEYYQYLQEKITREELFGTYPKETQEVAKEAWLAELGSDEYPHELVRHKIKSQIDKSKELILIGGPPCQAYSVAGRVRMQSNPDFATDPRHTLYLEYLKIIADFKPVVFVMENVKGILSSKLEGERIFPQIKQELQNPLKALGLSKKRNFKKDQYTLYSLTNDDELFPDKDFTIKSENYGIPQARHRVIILGIRNDINIKPSILKSKQAVSVEDVLKDLPVLRSGLSKIDDTYENWSNEINTLKDISVKLKTNLDRGSNFYPKPNSQTKPKNSEWYLDENIQGVVNHETRSHIVKDLHRYYFISSHAQKSGESLKLEAMPKHLLPNHKNVRKALTTKSLFNDRFRVQCAHKPATTITSHISKDGHYYIHYDPSQCRSLTVREAARLQTFPDNYKFEGMRTSQYHQVGNAVPPLLAIQIAEIVYDIVKQL